MTDEYREWAAAFVLGALDPDERARFEDHLTGCEVCRAEVAGFAPIPGLLARTDPPGAPVPGHALERALTAVGAERRRLEHGRRVWRLIALGAAAALLVVLAVVALPLGADQGADDRIALAVTSASATAEIDLIPEAWGSVVDIHVTEVDGPAAAERYTAWVVGDDGRWEPACTWGVADGAWTRVQGASSIHAEDVARVVVTPTDDRSRTWISARPDP